MLEALFGNKTAERTLLFLQNYGEGYAQGIADTFRVPISMVQKQLRRLEDGGIIVSQLKGRTRMYTWNPRNVLNTEVRALLEKALSLMSDDDTKAFFRERVRPRRPGKPL